MIIPKLHFILFILVAPSSSFVPIPVLISPPPSASFAASSSAAAAHPKHPVACWGTTATLLSLCVALLSLSLSHLLSVFAVASYANCLSG